MGSDLGRMELTCGILGLESPGRDMFASSRKKIGRRSGLSGPICGAVPAPSSWSRAISELYE